MNDFNNINVSENGVLVPSNPATTASGGFEPDPFAPENFTTTSDAAVSAEEITIDLRTPTDEEFVRVSPDSNHHLRASHLVVNREEGYGKSYYLLTPSMRLWAGNQPSLSKFVKTMHLFLFHNHDSEYGVWPVRDAFDSWAISELQVVESAKKEWTRRYTQGKVRKAYTSTSIDTLVSFPEKPMTGKDGILAQVFGDGFVIVNKDHPVIRKLMGVSHVG